MSYLDFYKLTAEPFSNAPVTRFYYSSRQHERAQQKIRYAIENMKGLGVVIGEIGAGKTTLARRVLDSLPDSEYHAAMLVIVHSGITADWLLKQIAIQLGVRNPAEQKLPLLSQVYRRLQQITQEGRKAVILIDEAQMLKTRELMEEFRGLLNLEVPGRKLITFVFFGLAELSEVLKIDEPLRNRVAVRCQLGPLDLTDLTSYVRHRLMIAGCPRDLFSPEALEHIFTYSKGVPRLINTICDNCLFEGFIAKSSVITGEIAEQVSLELGLEKPQLQAMADPGTIPGYPMPGLPSAQDRITASYPALQPGAVPSYGPPTELPVPPQTQPVFHYATPMTADPWQAPPVPIPPTAPALRPAMPPVPPTPPKTADQDHRTLLGSILRDGLKERATSTTMKAQPDQVVQPVTKPMMTPVSMAQTPVLTKVPAWDAVPPVETPPQSHTPHVPLTEEEAASYETLDDDLIVIEEIEAQPVGSELAEDTEDNVSDTSESSPVDLVLEPDEDDEDDTEPGVETSEPEEIGAAEDGTIEVEEEIELVEEVSEVEDEDIVRIAPAGLFQNDAPLPTGKTRAVKMEEEGVIELSDEEQITPGVRSRITEGTSRRKDGTVPMPFVRTPGESGAIEHLRDTDVPDFLEQMVEAHQPKPRQSATPGRPHETQEMASGRNREPAFAGKPGDSATWGVAKPSGGTIDGIPASLSAPVPPKVDFASTMEGAQALKPGDSQPVDTDDAVKQALESESLEQFERSLQSQVHSTSSPLEPLGTPSERFRHAAAVLDDMTEEPVGSAPVPSANVPDLDDGTLVHELTDDLLKETRSYGTLSETQPGMNWEQLARDLDPQRPRKSLEDIIREFGDPDEDKS